MSYRRRIYFTSDQKSEIWDRWQRGESMSSIGRVFGPSVKRTAQKDIEI